MNYHVSDAYTALRGTIRDLMENEMEPLSMQIERNGEIPEAILDRLRKLGLFGMPIPREYGGLGLTTLEEVMTYELLTWTNASIRSRIGTSNGIGSVGILYDGTDAQKRKYLPRIASGEWTTAFALTEPDAGSDAASIRTSAVLEGDCWILNGTKQFITNADCAQLFTTIAVTDEVKRARGGVTAFIVEKEMPGLVVGPADVKMGLRGSHTHELIFTNCRIPKENVIGGESMVGKGFHTAMRVLDKGRLSMGACALGGSQRILELCIDRVHQRMDRGETANDLQSANFDLADMAIQIHAARQMLYHAAVKRDQGENVTHEASMLKVFATEMASKIAGKALDLFETDGLLTRHLIEMYLRDSRLYRIYEGTNEIQRLIISRSLLNRKKTG
ncbi:MAG: acyl-CoA dehydrogenase family protein [Deltaproteobacteria bacterium]|nr:acyl-CoA dehydrogenase family protein [Deltaproteobacteria bacterium]